VESVKDNVAALIVELPTVSNKPLELITVADALKGGDHINGHTPTVAVKATPDAQLSSVPTP
jgi:hypothetical protein